MADPIALLRSSAGLNTLVDPARLPFDPDNLFLKAAYNIDYDSTGRISRRKGTAVTDIESAAHSLFCDDGDCFFVTGTSLCVLNEDFSYDSVATVTAAETVRYLQLDGKTYWMNGREKGVIENRTNAGWTLGTYSGPDSTRTYSPPPMGTILGYHGGCVLVASGSVIWHSDEYFPTGFDLARNYVPMEGAISMMRPVTGGVWVSDEKSVWFLSGASMRDLTHRKILTYPAVRGTDVMVDLSLIGEGEMSGIGVMWLSADGVCVGTEDGRAINLTKRVMEDLNVAPNGAAINIKDRYIGLIGDADSGQLGLCLEFTGRRASQYAGYNFNSMCKFGTTYLGANSNGIFQLDSGQYDYNSGSKASITSFFETPVSDWGIPNQKRVRFIHLSYETNGKIKITSTCDEDDETARAVSTTVTGNKQHAKRITGRRDIKGRHWSFRVDNVGGSDYSIDSILITPVITGREP